MFFNVLAIFLIVFHFGSRAEDHWDSNDSDSSDDWSNDNSDNSELSNAAIQTHQWSTSEQCARACMDNEPPRYCYYNFTLEYYVTMGRACDLCRPKNTNQLFNKPPCQCVEADGFERGILSINRMIPGPSIQVCQNDRIVIDVHNKIEGTEVTLHWHGLYQYGFQYYDGVPFVTQCPITSNTIFRYQFVARNSGTHFYHSHVAVQKLDGQYGSLIVRQPPSMDPHRELYDEDLVTHVILLSDWMHEMSIERFPGRLKRHPGQVPENVLINGKGRWTDPITHQTTKSQLETFYVVAGKKYRFRIINSFSSVCLAQLTIQGHKLQLIAQDGESVSPVFVDTIDSSSGERMDVVVHANRSVSAYWIHLKALGECQEQKVHQLAILKYNGGPDVPKTAEPKYFDDLNRGIIYNSPNDTCEQHHPNVVCPDQLTSVTAVEKKLLKPEPDYQIMLPFKFYFFDDSLTNFFSPGIFNNFLATISGSLVESLVDDISFIMPSVPPLSQNLRAGEACNRWNKPPNCSTPCNCPHIHHIKKGAVVEVVIYDQISAPLLNHPFHLHGYSFRLLKRGRFADKRNISESDITSVLQEHRKMLNSGEYEFSPAKDTVMIPEGGYAIFRFLADNPGWWLLHCHFLYHTMIGMNVILHVGDKFDLPPVPRYFPRCYTFKPMPFADE